MTNVTNFGNVMINVSLSGYARTPGDGLAMSCDINGDIAIENLKFDHDGTGGKTDLDSTPQNITDLTIPQINLAGVNPGDYTTTYWDLFISPVGDPFGMCTGIVIFTAWNS